MTPGPDRNSPTQQNIAAKVAAACKKHTIPPQYYEVITVCGQLDKACSNEKASQEPITEDGETNTSNKKIGLSLRGDVVMCSRYGSPFQGQLIHGDILVSVNNIVLPDEKNAVKNAFIKVASIGGKVTIRAIRLKRFCPWRCSLPKGFEAEEGYEYNWVMLYFIGIMKLGLAMKEIDGKLYVALLKPDGLACMGLSMGERIVDIDGQLVNDVKTAVSIMSRQMERNGMIRICVQSPTNDMQRNMLRRLITEACAPDEPTDNVPAEETLAFGEKGIKTLKTFKGEPKPILKVGTAKCKGKLNFNEKTVESGMLVEVQTKLLVTVPPAKTIESEAAMNAPK